MLESLLDAVGYGLCHQLPERSFFGASVQLPVCARDTGIYLGFMIAFLVLQWTHRDRPTRMPPAVVSVLLALGVAAMVFDGVTSYAGIRPTTNAIRLVTGLLTGYAISAWLLPVLNMELWAEAGRDRVLGSPSRFAAFVVSLPLAFAAIWWLAPLAGALYPVVVAGSILFTFIVVNLVIVSLLPPFERRARSVGDLGTPLLIAFVLTLLELWLSAVLKGWVLGLAA